jgi:hypothetical protein
VPRNNKAKSSSAKGTIVPEDGQLLVTETCMMTWDTDILMFWRIVFLKKCNFNKVHELVFNMCDSNMHSKKKKI